jgi:mannitol-specific phosphotransferase system IIBC component
LTPAYGAIFGHVLGSLVAFFVSTVYLLAQANIQATAELEKARKASEPEKSQSKATKTKAKKVQ